MADQLDRSALLEPYRRYLSVLASVHLDPDLRHKLDPADLVQQTLLRAYAAITELRSIEPPVLTAWLRKILANELADAEALPSRQRDMAASARSRPTWIDRRRAWSAAGGGAILAERPADQNEQMLRLADALSEVARSDARSRRAETLPGLDAAADRPANGKSVPAVASLLRRGLEQLRFQLSPGGSSHA